MTGELDVAAERAVAGRFELMPTAGGGTEQTSPCELDLKIGTGKAQLVSTRRK